MKFMFQIKFMIKYDTKVRICRLKKFIIKYTLWAKRGHLKKSIWKSFFKTLYDQKNLKDDVRKNVPFFLLQTINAVVNIKLIVKSQFFISFPFELL